MIQAKFRQNEAGQIVSYEVTGHAGFREEGEDIVCAAVSVLAIETVNSAERLASHQMIVEEKPKEGGYLYAEIGSELSEEQQVITQVLLKHLYFSLQDVAEAYPDYVTVEID